MTTPPEPTIVPPGDVQALGPPWTGVWEVETRGSRHIWDLDEMTYCRLPGPRTGGGAMLFDGRPVPISRVEAWPKVGTSFFVWYDDPDYPRHIEHYRISSTVRSIHPYEPAARSDGDEQDDQQVAGDGR